MMYSASSTFLRSLGMAAFAWIVCDGFVIAHAEPPRIERQSAAIVRGQPAYDAESVVLVEQLATGARCSGTLVAPRVVVTAKHCVQAPSERQPLSTEMLRVGFVPRNAVLAGDAAFGTVAEVRALEGAYRPAPYDVEDLAGRDFAVLTLRELAPVAPSALAPAGELPEQADALLAVAFGEGMEGVVPSAGTRRAATVYVRGHAGDVLAVSSAACAGDSGGALFDAEGRLSAVISSAVGPCDAGETQATLLGAGLDLLEEAMCQAGEGCMALAAEASPNATHGGCFIGRKPTAFACAPWIGVVAWSLLRARGVALRKARGDRGRVK